MGGKDHQILGLILGFPWFTTLVHWSLGTIKKSSLNLLPPVTPSHHSFRPRLAVQCQEHGAVQLNVAQVDEARSKKSTEPEMAHQELEISCGKSYKPTSSGLFLHILLKLFFFNHPSMAK